MTQPADPAAPAGPSPALPPEDAKLVTLARATRARTGAAQGAAVRDADGRTYAAATVDLPSLRVSALGVCVAMAVASGARDLEAAVVLGDDAAGAADEAGTAAVRDLAGPGVPVLAVDRRGAVVGRSTS